LGLGPPNLTFGGKRSSGRACSSGEGLFSALSNFAPVLAKASLLNRQKRIVRSRSTGYTDLLSREMFHWSRSMADYAGNYISVRPIQHPAYTSRRRCSPSMTKCTTLFPSGEAESRALRPDSPADRVNSWFRIRSLLWDSRWLIAIARNFVTYDRTEKSLRPQIMLYLGAFAGSVVSATWKPGNVPLWTAGYQGAVAQVPIGIGTNFLGEFAPEIVRSLRRKGKQR
jgi:hypothetical protein